MAVHCRSLPRPKGPTEPRQGYTAVRPATSLPAPPRDALTERSGGGDGALRCPWLGRRPLGRADRRDLVEPPSDGLRLRDGRPPAGSSGGIDGHEWGHEPRERHAAVVAGKPVDRDREGHGDEDDESGDDE